MSVVLGIDTGGTFTDFVLVDEERGAITTTKVPSTPNHPASAVAAGLAQLKGLERVDRLVIGTTVATNAVLERRGPMMVYITNRGFEDIPFIGRLDKARLYDVHWRKPKPLVQRRHCFGIGGRLDAHGREILPLQSQELDDVAKQLELLADEDISVAICCLFSYLNPSHELSAARAVSAALPHAYISVSHEVSPLWREYERSSTTLADAFVKPVIARYVSGVSNVIGERMATSRWNMLGSNGGYLRADEVERRPAQVLLSGLAGGVTGGRYFSRLAGASNAFTLDIGGTSTDIGVLLNGEQQYATEFALDFGIPVTIPCVAVRTIGAGGGSIAWIDKGGLLHVGPESAGAEPGPVAYCRGGTQPTVTDANLVLGRLDPGFFLGGAMRLNRDAAQDAFARLGAALGLSAEDAALAVIRTIDENMANAIRLISVERGLDPRNFALICFGGAGPLHGRAVAERLGINTILVPPYPGLCSAFGAAIADARIDRVQTFFTESTRADIDAIAAALEQLRQRSLADLKRCIDTRSTEVRSSADLRYVGQNYELEVPLPDTVNSESWQNLLECFAEAHEVRYGFSLPGEPVELINLRVTALQPESRHSFSGLTGKTERSAAPRPVQFERGTVNTCPIFQRASLGPEKQIIGPAIIEESDSTTLLHPGDRLELVNAGVLRLTISMP
jgi:N-methylhydantoinase A